jgi:hypothetical protein
MTHPLLSCPSEAIPPPPELVSAEAWTAVQACIADSVRSGLVILINGDGSVELTTTTEGLVEPAKRLGVDPGFFLEQPEGKTFRELSGEHSAEQRHLYFELVYAFGNARFQFLRTNPGMAMAVWHMVQAFATEDPDKHHWIMVRRALAEDNPELPEDENARRLLGAALCKHMRELQRLIGPEPTEGLDRETDGMFWLDAVGIGYLNQLGGNDLAEELTDKARNRFKEYLDTHNPWTLWRLWWHRTGVDQETGRLLPVKEDPKDPNADIPRTWSPIIRFLARILWWNGVKDQWDRFKRTSGVPAIPRAVSTVYRTAALDPRTTMDLGRGVLVDANGVTIGAPYDLARITMGLSEASRHIQALRTTPGQYLFRDLGETIHRRWVEGETHPGHIVIEGGRSALASKWGLSKHGHLDQLEEALIGGQCFPAFQLGSATIHGLWTFREEGKSQSRRLIVDMASFWEPNVLARLRNENPSVDPYLVALPAVRGRTVGRFNEKGPCLAMGLLVNEEFSRRADELVAKNGVQLTGERLREMADEVGLPSKYVDRLVEAWLADHGQGDLWPFLKKTGQGRYLPGDEKVEEFYRRQGQRKQKARQGGRKLAKLRQGGK